MAVRYYIGTSGWHYDHWRSIFYPEDLPKTKWLEFYAKRFDTVELNNSFYRLPSEAAFANWRDSSPDNFTLTVKVSRFITHIKRLKETAGPLDNFIARANILGEKLDPLLYQLPPNMHRDDERLESFLSILPRGLQHVIEFRHESWMEEGVFEIMRRNNAAFCIFDMPDLECPLVATASFAYVRFHGSGSLYSSNYSDNELTAWAKKIARLAASLEKVYIYFNNDALAFAVNNAITLRDRLQEMG